ncbi:MULTISPECIES: hypothetical protein [unclassified Streptomyces]|uniref:hypothetical protein n=1 Tax=unclassified Streptomyces TaxID=2593676 RepID=UPI00365DBC0D
MSTEPGARAGAPRSERETAQPSIDTAGRDGAPPATGAPVHPVRRHHHTEESPS